jgi:hypothetical protein
MAQRSQLNAPTWKSTGITAASTSKAKKTAKHIRAMEGDSETLDAWMRHMSLRWMPTKQIMLLWGGKP